MKKILKKINKKKFLKIGGIVLVILCLCYISINLGRYQMIKHYQLDPASAFLSAWEKDSQTQIGRDYDKTMLSHFFRGEMLGTSTYTFAAEKITNPDLKVFFENHNLYLKSLSRDYRLLIANNPELSYRAFPEKNKSHEELFPNSKISGVKLYISEKLNVGFTYKPENIQNTDVFIKENGNTIFLTDDKELKNLDSGQYIKVFDKDPNLGFKKSIEKQLSLENVPMEGCSFFDDKKMKEMGYKSNSFFYPIYQLGDATSRGDENDCMAGEYSSEYGTSFFFMNARFPSKFFFVSLGQHLQAIDGNGNNWIDSFRILN